MRSARTGFTLSELMVVVTIVGVAGLLTYPKMNATIADQRVNRAAIELSNQMQVAFAIALRDRKPVQISFDTSSAQFKIADRAGNVFLRTGLTGFNLTAKNVTMSRSTVEVYPEGLAQDSLSITLSAKGNGATFTRRVRMTRGGLVQAL